MRDPINCGKEKQRQVKSNKLCVCVCVYMYTHKNFSHMNFAIRIIWSPKNLVKFWKLIQNVFLEFKLPFDIN